MDAIAETLDRKLHAWQEPIAQEVRLRVLEIIEVADQDWLDLVRSRACEQEVLDLIDEA